MGGIIIDGMTGFLATARGKPGSFNIAISALKQFARHNKGVKMHVEPLVAGTATMVTVWYAGSIMKFENVVRGLEKLRGSIALDTMPLPEKIAIGTWPVPEKPGAKLVWDIAIRRKRPRSKRGAA